MENCIFCKIANKEIPSKIVYEDANVIAFNDINPVAPIHVLVVPKQHIKSMNDIDENNSQIIAHIHVAAKKIAEELGIAQKGYRLINNCGPDAGQTVMHLHYHLIGGVNLGLKII
ncbi:MAG TPA: histidine triad nucleotide-binding protein [Clostridiaceae bacterium]|nr:histidine triad nucleotide-binding protein [Clostridiaceae bacterium]